MGPARVFPPFQPPPTRGLDTSVIAKNNLAVGYGRVASVEAKTARREASLSVSSRLVESFIPLSLHQYGAIACAPRRASHSSAAST